MNLFRRRPVDRRLFQNFAIAAELGLEAYEDENRFRDGAADKHSDTTDGAASHIDCEASGKSGVRSTATEAR